MTFTFDETLATPLARVRANIGDTLDSDGVVPIFSDERIAAVLTRVNDDELQATVVLLNQIVSQYARKVSSSVGPYREEAQQAYEHYKTLRDEFAALYASETFAPLPAYVEDALSHGSDGSWFRRRA